MNEKYFSTTTETKRKIEVDMGVEDTHPQYDRRAPQWVVMRDTSAGEDVIKIKGIEYLPMLGGQDDGQYEAYKIRATYHNATGRTIDGLSGMVFRKPPQRIHPTGMAPFMEDVTLDGLEFQPFAELVVEEILTTARAGILVDFPQVPEGQVTRAAADEMGLQPFWHLFKAEAILNWKTMRIGTRTLLSEVRLMEVVEEPGEEEFDVERIEQIRVLDLVVQDDGSVQYRQRLYRVDENRQWAQHGEDLFPLQNGAPLDFIPFVFLGPRDTGTDIDKPPLIDLAYVNVSHYRTSAQLEHGAHFTALPTPYVFGVDEKDVPDSIGPEVIWHGTDEEVKVGMLEYTGKGLGSLEKRLEVKEQQMAALGARMLAPDKRMVEAVETAQIHRQGESSVLSSLSQAVSFGLTRALEIARDWMGMDGEVEIVLNKDFFPAPINPQLLQVLFTMVQAGRMSSEAFFDNLQRGEIIDPEIKFEEEMSRIQTDPRTLTLLEDMMDDDEDDDDEGEDDE